MPDNTDKVHDYNLPEIDGIRFLPGKTTVLVIAPHGPFEETKTREPEYRNDFRTGLIAEAIHEDKGWLTIINDSFIKPDAKKKEPPDFKQKRLDIYKAEQAEKIPGYLETIKRIVDSSDVKTLVIWIHGMADSSAVSQRRDHIKAKKMNRSDGDLHALIGYGQGQHPRIEQLENLGLAEERDKKSQFTAEEDTVESFKNLVTKKGLRTLLTVDDADNFRGRDPERLNQWFLNQGYSFDEVESFQIEIREKGFRKTPKQCIKTAKIIADALDELVPASEEVPHATADTIPTIITEPVNDETAQETGAGSMTEETDVEVNPAAVSANASANLPDNTTVHQLAPTSSSEPVIISEGTDDPLALEAFEHLKTIFHTHFHNAMVEAGQYIINKFYGGNPIDALAKNKSKDQPQSIKKLIDMLRKASETTEGDVPSLAWFYNAVNLAAHEAIFEQKGSQTFRKLGHSHKLQLLHVPKLKGMPADKIRKDITRIFNKKKQLAKYAYNKKELSVRNFKKYINEKCPSAEIDLTNLPSISRLRMLERKKPGEMKRLINQATKKIETNQRLIDTYKKTVISLKGVLAGKD